MRYARVGFSANASSFKIGSVLSGARGFGQMFGRRSRCAQPASRLHASPMETMPTRRMTAITVDALRLVKEGGLRGGHTHFLPDGPGAPAAALDTGGTGWNMIGAME